MQAKLVKRRWRLWRVLACLVVVTTAVVCFHGRILRGVAELLVVEEPREAAQAVLMIGGESRFDEAAKLHDAGAKVVLLLRARPGRLERLGILRSADEMTRRELLSRGIPAADMSYLSDEPVANSQLGAVLCHWLQMHPQEQIDILCDRFSTRKWHVLLRRSADADLMSRIRLVALPHRQFDQTNWWHSKAGSRAILNGYLRLGFTCWHRGPSPDGRECTLADFESVAVRRAMP
jgi:hypothetical protein